MPGEAVEARGVTVETALREIEEGLARAYHVDVTAFTDRVLADDCVLHTGVGTTSDKRAALDDQASGHPRVTHSHCDEMHIQPLGTDAAMVRGQYTWDAMYVGRPAPRRLRYLRVYARSDAGWQVTAAQVIPVLA